MAQILLKNFAEFLHIDRYQSLDKVIAANEQVAGY